MVIFNRKEEVTMWRLCFFDKESEFMFCQIITDGFCEAIKFCESIEIDERWPFVKVVIDKI